jgi:RimJ/RimL family protein N-acetyltransferase
MKHKYAVMPPALEAIMEPLVIRTERDDLLLRETTESDVPALVTFFTRNQEHFGWKGEAPNPKIVRDAFVAIEGLLQLGLWHGGELIGHLSLSFLPEPYFGEIGYLLDKEHTGNGYATMSVRALVRHAFSGADFRALSANVWEENPKSWKVLERVGFKLIESPEDVRNYRLEANDWFAMSRPM